MKVFEKLTLPNGSQIQNRIAKAAMDVIFRRRLHQLTGFDGCCAGGS